MAAVLQYRAATGALQPWCPDALEATMEGMGVTT